MSRINSGALTVLLENQLVLLKAARRTAGPFPESENRIDITEDLLEHRHRRQDNYHSKRQRLGEDE